MAVFRANAISAVAGKCPSDDLARDAARAARAAGVAIARALVVTPRRASTAAATAARVAATVTAELAAADIAASHAAAVFANVGAARDAAVAAANAAADGAAFAAIDGYAANATTLGFGANAAAVNAQAELWRLVSDDCERLDGGESVVALLAMPLWELEPEWFGKAWAQASEWMTSSGDGFGLWRGWYIRKQRGARFEFADFDVTADADFSVRLCAQGIDWWDREPAQVNAEIAGWIAELGKQDEHDASTPDSLSTDAEPPSGQDTPSPFQIREILQEIASPQAVIANGQISFRANAEFETPSGDLDAWHPRHLLDIIDVLRLGLRDNAPNPLKVGLAKYHEVLARDPDLPVITTLQACIGVVRTTFQSDDHEIWAEGLEEPFDALFQGHKRLLSDYPNLQERRRLRDQITPTPAARKVDGLNADIARFADIAAQLKELGVTDETAHAYLQSIVDIGRQIALGSGTDAPGPDDAEDWTPPAQIRADMSGVMARIESQLSLLLSITGHPNVQAALVAIAPEVARLLAFFG